MMSSGGGGAKKPTEQDDVVEPEKARAKTPEPAEAPSESDPTEAGSGDKEGAKAADAAPAKQSSRASPEVPASPQPQGGSYPQMYPPHLTPQPGAGYYLPVQYPHAHVTPDRASPAVLHGMYDAASFLHQSQFGTPGSGQYSGIPQPPLSPRSVPPASPLFPRAASNASGDPANFPIYTPGTPVQGMSASGLPYLSPAQGSAGFGGGMYPSYSVSSFTGSADEPWSAGERESSQSNSYPPSSSPKPYGSGSRQSSRSYSFDDMLPPPLLEHQESGGSNSAYSPYSGAQAAAAPPGAAGAVFPQQQWAYGGEMYASPASPLQPRQSPMMAPYPGVLPPNMGSGMRPPLGPTPYGQGGGGMYYATSPGPPIQTANTNKGPDGANLFIFHIPNNFSNLDMYNLFLPYGNLLSVRIMVERDTGRSRGFGFVSYDNPESAAMAIKELNGYAIGNKRLKVQHKQIRSHDNPHQQHNNYGDWDGGGYTRGESGGSFGHEGGAWYDENQPHGLPQSMDRDASQLAGDDQDNKGDENKDQSTSSPSAKPTTTSVLPPKLPDMASEGAEGGLSSPLGQLEPLRSALPEIAERGGAPAK